MILLILSLSLEGKLVHVNPWEPECTSDNAIEEAFNHISEQAAIAMPMHTK